jgi:hypothetical protein
MNGRIINNANQQKDSIMKKTSLIAIGSAALIALALMGCYKVTAGGKLTLS